MSRHTVQITESECGGWYVSVLVPGIHDVIFPLPQIEHWLLLPQDGYGVVFPLEGKPESGGRIVQGHWLGHVYTYGVSEQDNPTPVTQVQAHLENALEAVLAYWS